LDRRLSLIEPPKKKHRLAKISNSVKFTVGASQFTCCGGTGSIPAEITDTVKVTDIFGAAQQLQASQITLSDSPIFVEIKS
jgi:hypothetical protein